MVRSNDFEWKSPTNATIKEYLKKWGKKVPYAEREKSLDKLYKSFPKNDNLYDVLVKVTVLNDFYSTNIMSVYDVAKKIVACRDFDNRIKKFDYSLVNSISNITINGKKKCFYSFATKYCSHHNPEAYPIFDKNVQRVLWELNKKDNFTRPFSLKILKDYKKFCEVISEFKNFYKLNCTYKELDVYMWQYGKEYFEMKGVQNNEQY